jgi:hypothetical protein
MSLYQLYTNNDEIIFINNNKYKVIMNSQAISKIVFLVFVVFISGYVMLNNKTVSLEGFEDKQKSDVKKQPKDKVQDKPSVPQKPVEGEKSITQKVNEIYKELYGADPKPAETAFYVKFFNNRETTPAYMKEIISTSAPTLQKTLKAGTLPLIPDTPQGTEDEVIAIFNEILERHPDAEELQYYSTFIKGNPANLEKMKVLLLQSNEYKRLQKLQNNTAYGYLLGGITDRQLALMVLSVYNQVAGSGNKLDDDTMKFLKKKYLEFQLDEKVFKKFVQDFVLFDSSSKTANNNTQVSSKTQQDATAVRANSAITDKLAQSGFEKENKMTPSASSQVPNTAKQSTTTESKDKAKEQYTNKDVQQCTPDSKKNNVDTDKLIKMIKENADCQFSKNGVDDKYRNEQSLATAVNDRNRDELKNICERNKTFSKYHYEDMVLVPGQEWTIPQKHPPVCYGSKGNYNPQIEQTALIGTLLGDAKDTEIGSIMPKFTYKEYYN